MPSCTLSQGKCMPSHPLSQGECTLSRTLSQGECMLSRTFLCATEPTTRPSGRHRHAGAGSMPRELRRRHLHLQGAPLQATLNRRRLRPGQTQGKRRRHRNARVQVCRRLHHQQVKEECHSQRLSRWHRPNLHDRLRLRLTLHESRRHRQALRRLCLSQPPAICGSKLCQPPCRRKQNSSSFKQTCNARTW